MQSSSNSRFELSQHGYIVTREIAMLFKSTFRYCPISWYKHPILLRRTAHPTVNICKQQIQKIGWSCLSTISIWNQIWWSKDDLFFPPLSITAKAKYIIFAIHRTTYLFSILVHDVFSSEPLLYVFTTQDPRNVSIAVITSNNTVLPNLKQSLLYTSSALKPAAKDRKFYFLVYDRTLCL